MIFPDTPEFLFDLLNYKLSSALLGKKISGVGGNETDHKWLTRLNPQTTSTPSQIQRLLNAVRKNHRAEGNPTSIFDGIRVPASDINNSWVWSIYGMRLEAHLPRSLDAIRAISSASMQLEIAHRNRDPKISEFFDQLPIKEAITIAQLKSISAGRNSNFSQDELFSTQFFTSSVVMLALIEELQISVTSDERLSVGSFDECLNQLVLTGAKRIEGNFFNVWVHSVLKWLDIATVNEFVRIIRRPSEQQETILREVRHWMSGNKAPGYSRILEISEKLENHLEENLKYGAEIVALGLVALIFFNAEKKLIEIEKVGNWVDPLAPFNDLAAFGRK